MNLRQVLCQLGLLFLVLSAIQVVIALWAGVQWLAGVDAERQAFIALLISAGIGSLLGLAGWLLNRRFQEWLVGRREALLLVAMTWILGAALCGVPYFAWAKITYTAPAPMDTTTAEAAPTADVLAPPARAADVPGAWADAGGVVEEVTPIRTPPDAFSPPEMEPSGADSNGPVAPPALVRGTHPFDSFASCYFEAMSGLSTTGATILTEIGTVPRSLLLWRALTHWLGGLGIVVLFVAVLPSLGAGGKKLFRVESSGVQQTGVRPHIAETARMLWLIYVGLTVTQTLLLRMAGMTWFDAVCHTFSTLATGGFSTLDTSLGGFNSVSINIITMIFMILAGVNFGIYYNLIRRRFRTVWRDPELRLYLLLVLVASTVITISIADHAIVLTTGEVLEPSIVNALHHGMFQGVSIHTGTGFCTADYDRWGFVPHAVLIITMFAGASAGSTAGGIKIIRIWIMLRIMVSEIERAFRPNVVRPLKVGGSVIGPELRQGTLAYILGAILIFVAGSFLLMVLEHHPDMTYVTSASATAATFFNVGPGFGLVGPDENYNWMTPASKTLLSLLMALGRLELFAIIVLFAPRFWSGD